MNSIPSDLVLTVENLTQKAPAAWLASACEVLRSLPATTSPEAVLKRMPTTNNADLSFLMTEAVQLACGQMSWEALSWTLQTISITYRLWLAKQQVEFLWAGPPPADKISARRIDQVLYDLIASAKREILLITFVAARIDRLTSELLKAARRGVKIRLILEFTDASEGQLSFDALKAFPQVLTDVADVYYWPVQKRERNQAGNVGKLHAKMAIIDDTALVSSANLTDDAFNRNLEVGAMVTNSEFLASATNYFETLISEGTLDRLKL